MSWLKSGRFARGRAVARIWLYEMKSRSLSRACGAGKKSMLKIVRSANPDFVLFTLSGHIDAEHAAELQVAFDGETLPIVLDLLEVKRVDREVVADLARWNT